jgi:hypothetical protein
VPYCTLLEWEKDFDLELYNQLNERAGHQDALAPGCLGRVVGKVGSGARIIEIWASPEAARDFSVKNTPHIAELKIALPDRTAAFETSIFVTR